MIDDVILVINVRPDAFQHQLSQSISELPQCQFTVFVIYDQFCNHRIIERRNLITGKQGRVNAHTLAARKMYVCNGSRTRPEIVFRILCIYPYLDGVSGDMDILLLISQIPSRRNANLFPDQVYAGDPFRDRMFYLNPGVHLNEIEIPVLVLQEFNGACAVISGHFCRFDCNGSHLLSEFFVNGR